MDRVNLKRRLLGNRAFPRIPWRIREILVAPETGRDLTHAIVDMASSDPQLAAALRDEAGIEASTPIDNALAVRLDAGALRRAMLRGWVASAKEVPGRTLDHTAHWKNALRTAALAETIAQSIQSPVAHLAFVAGLVCNMGRPALDLVVEGGYQHRLEGPAADGLPLLESEQLTYGADHTQVGKWLAEHWRLPFPVVNAVWLHHLRPEALDELDGTHDLTEIAALAAMLALLQPDAAPTTPMLARGERLGFDADTLARIHRETKTPRIKTSGKLDEAQVVAKGDGELRSRIAYWRSLTGVLQSVRPPLSLDDALVEVARGVQDAFALAPALAYVVDPDGHSAACRWHDTMNDAEPLTLSHATSRNPLAELIANLADSGNDPTAAPHGLVCAPLVAEGEVLGQLVFEAGSLSALNREATLASIQTFAAACGSAIQRCIDHERITANQEDMAAAMQRLEHAHRLSLRNARFDSAATLASGAAHQLNNPLAIVSGRAQLLLNKTDDSEQTRGLETILRESRRAARILSELMQFARPGDPKFADADAASILRKTAASMRDEFEARGISVVEDMAAPQPRVPVDGAQLEQVFTHVLRNAMESMRDGGRLILRARPSKDARSLVLQVEDTGPGIHPEAIDHIFEPFFTASHDSEPHTGLGLAVCRAIIDRHHGAITLHNNPDRGCTCTITLSSTERHALHEPDEIPDYPPVLAAGKRIFREPHQQPEEIVVASVPTRIPELEKPVDVQADLDKTTKAEATTEREDAPPASNPVQEMTPRILFADRDEDLREVLAEALRSRGYDVQTVPDGLEAHAAILTGKFNMVIAELNLPALSGRDLLDQLRSRFPGLPLIILAGAATPDEDITAVKDLGADLCLRKPFGLESLLTEMAGLLEKSRLAKGA